MMIHIDQVRVKLLPPADSTVFAYHLGPTKSGHALEAVVEQGVGGPGGY